MKQQYRPGPLEQLIAALLHFCTAVLQIVAVLLVLMLVGQMVSSIAKGGQRVIVSFIEGR